MSYMTLVYLHLGTVLPAIALGALQFAVPKGTVVHRSMGRVYMVLMFTTAGISLLLPAAVGPQVLGHFGFIHAFSFLTLYSVPAAYFAARRGDIRTHRGNMIGLYVGGILIAGSLAFAPGRLLNQWVFG